MHDLTIRNGLVVDGTGAAGRTADVAIDGGVISAIGDDVGPGRREIDADGAMVAPGWVDVHTHYDGQATWDPEMAPSSWHGATTVVMGNCGVGFAPVRKGSEDFLIELMEAVEDIPGTALHEGIDWQWESFGEYLDALDTMPRTVDVAAQVPHVALRAFVLGERAHDEDVTADEYAEMARLTADALRAGALGFSTSRTILHKSRHGLIPGTRSMPDELLAIGQGMADAGGGVFQLISDQLASSEEERAWVRELAEMGLTVTYSLAQSPMNPRAYVTALDEAAELTASGAEVWPQVPARPTGMLYGLQTSLHPFIACPSYRPLWNEPLEARVAALRDPELRARLVDEEFRTRDRSAAFLARNWAGIYRLGDPPDYEPRPETSIRGGGRRLAAGGRRQGPALRPARLVRGPGPRGDPGDDQPPGVGRRPLRRRRPLRPHLRRLVPHLPADPLDPRP